MNSNRPSIIIMASISADVQQNIDEQLNFSFQNLPPHVITKILSFLPISDLLNACLINKSWLEASLHENFTKKIAVKFENCNFSPSNDKIKEIMNATRYFSKVNFNFVVFNEECDEFWIRFGKYIVDIKINSCEIDQNQFFHILQFLPNLKSLCIKNSSGSITDIILFDKKAKIVKDKIKKCLSSIEKFEFHSLNRLTDKIFEKFTSFTNKIKSFNLYDCRSIKFSSTLVKFCEKNQESLINLNIPSENFDQDKYVNDLIKLKKLKLKECTIDTDCSDRTLDNFFKNQNNLEMLSIENLNNPKMISLCKHLKNLKHLQIMFSFELDDSLVHINNLKQIEVLRISDVNKTSDSVLCEMFKDKKLMLRKFQFSLPITNDFLLKISDSCPNLEDLDLRFNDKIPKRGVQIIFKNLTKLERLLFGPVDMFINMDDLEDMEDMEDIEEGIDTDQEECEFICSISNLKKLKHLDLLNVAPFVGFTVKDIAKLKNLTTLNIDRIFKLTDEDIKHLALSLNNIENINFGRSLGQNMTDEMIKLITKQWKNLKILRLSNCAELTNKSLMYIAENCKNLKLKDLIGFYNKQST